VAGGIHAHGAAWLFATYEAFSMVSASQTVQHSKWLEGAARLSWRARIPSFNVLLTSTAWRNEHNGFSHQGPGLIQVMLTHRGEIARIYFPPDANCLLSVADHCLRSTSYVNLIVIDKQPQLQWLTIEEAVEHCVRGASVWKWAGNDDPSHEPDVVLACAARTSRCGPLPRPRLHRGGNHHDPVRHDGSESGNALSPRDGRHHQCTPHSCRGRAAAGVV
jgi:xylulose-5-phosphate/fructose-6-phosphate phosphoketolase